MHGFKLNIMKIQGVQTRTIRENVIRHVMCDKCREIIDEPEDRIIFNFELEITTGQEYDHDSDETTKDLDLCHQCAINLVELLESKGYKFNVTED